MKDALKKAYESKGMSLPNAGEKRTTIKLNKKSPGSKKSSQKKSKNEHKIVSVFQESHHANISRPASDVSSSSSNSTSTKTIELKDEPDFTLKFSEKSVVKFNVSTEPESYVYLPPLLAGHQTQAHQGEWRDEREIVIGLDFGTSSVKVIIGDKTIDKAFAVPFSAHEGIKRYLLPSRLYENGSKDYSLSSGKTIQRDLKLALLAYPNNPAAHIKLITFLALVIKHSRGWLLSQHKGVYQSSKILWKLVLGLPSAHHLKSEHHDLFIKLANAAWSLSVIDSPIINLSNTLKALNEPCILNESDSAEICVVPEIAAQIYGYVSSNSFDPNAPNKYLMVDIGAGTVDSCLFHVKPARGGKCDFRFYTTQVQPNGVMNLFRHHMDWWLNALKFNPEKLPPDLNSLQFKMFCTDRFSAIPESFKDYFSNIEVTFKKGVEDPDQFFFKKRVFAQVRGQTLWRTWNDGFLSQQDLSGIPMYLCGGGARMRFYSQLEYEMPKTEGCTWLNAIARKLVVPKTLIAPSMAHEDYDRLSVAFGLSFLDVRQVIQAIPEPPVPPLPQDSWDINYISKDMC